MFCIKCGAKRVNEAHYCHSCGTTLEKIIELQITSSTRNIKNNVNTEKVKSYRVLFIITIFTSYGLSITFYNDPDLKLPLLMLFVLNSVVAYSLAFELNKSTRAVVIYTILALFAVLNLIPFIGLLSDVSKISRNSKDLKLDYK